MSRHIKRGGRIWIRVFPDKPVSQKPAEVRMGNGKGNPEYFVCEIQPGKIIFEMDGVTEPLAKEAFALASAKLPFRTIVVQRMLADRRRPMKPSELRGKNGEELQKELEGLLRAQFGLRMQLATQQLSNTSQLKKVKRDIARVRTIMKEKVKAK